MPDLWPKEIGELELIPPITVLREQADALTKRTGGVLVGSVHTSGDANGFMHLFSLEVPSMEDYSYTLFSATHNVMLYPVTIGFRAGNMQYRVDNYNGLLATLSKMFRDPKTNQIVAALKAQVPITKRDKAT